MIIEINMIAREWGELNQYLGIGEPLRIWKPDPV